MRKRKMESGLPSISLSMSVAMAIQKKVFGLLGFIKVVMATQKKSIHLFR